MQENFPGLNNQAFDDTFVDDLIDTDEDAQKATSIPKPKIGQELDQSIINAAQEIIDLKQTVKEKNQAVKAVFERMQAEGIPKAALRDTIKELKLTEEQRIAYDTGILITRRALGIPVQVDMFEGTLN